MRTGNYFVTWLFFKYQTAIFFSKDKFFYSIHTIALTKKHLFISTNGYKFDSTKGLNLSHA